MPLGLTLAFVLLTLAWLGATPLGRVPDEPAHYVKAVALGAGELRGAAVRPQPEYTPVQRRWLGRTTRSFDLPRELAILPSPPCPVFSPTTSAGCQQEWPQRSASPQPSYVATYQPFTYSVPAAATTIASTPRAAWLLARAALALLSLALLVLGIMAYWDPRAPSVSVAAVALAVTPMVVFLASSLNPSGAETTAAFSLGAGLLRLARRDGTAPRALAWWATGAGGVVLAVTRSVGPYYLGAIALVVIGVAGLSPLLERLRKHRGPALAVAGAVATAALLNMWWERTYQPPVSWLSGPRGEFSLRQVPVVGRELVGVFGWFEFHMPSATYAVWQWLAAALLAAALILGTWRQRVALAGFAAAIVVVVVVFHAVLPAQTGFEVQGRYVIALAVVVPLLAGEVARTTSRRIPTVPLVALSSIAAVATAVIHGVGWLKSAHRYAVGTSGPRWFLDRAEWEPPAGWPVWIAIAAIGVATLMMTIALAAQQQLRTAAPGDSP